MRFERYLQRAQRELDDAEHKLRGTVQLREIVARLDDFAARIRNGLDALSWNERRQIVRTLIAKIEVDEKAATIVYRLPSTDRTPRPPSDPEPGSDGRSKNEPGANCRLRSQGGRCVTGRRSDWYASWTLPCWSVDVSQRSVSSSFSAAGARRHTIVPAAALPAPTR